jgi:GNAT superfamily N-acetyltransferase
MLEVRTWAELDRSQRLGVASLLWSEGDFPGYSANLHAHRSRGQFFQRYRALVAVEGGEVLGHAGAIRVSFRTSRRSQVVCGISDVVVRPDATRRGIASRLLRRAHADARREGLDWSFLWTRRSWGAHRAYEKLGYFDLYSFASAVRPPRDRGRRGRGVRGFRLRAAETADLDRMEGILAAASRPRLGFTDRDPHSFRDRVTLGWRALGDFRVLEAAGRAVGYLELQLDAGNAIVRECVVTGPQFARPLLRILEATAGPRWIGLANSSFVADQKALLRHRGYRIADAHHAVLMADPISRRGARERAELGATAADPRFFVQRGDLF